MEEFNTELTDKECAMCKAKGYFLSREAHPLHGHKRTCKKCGFSMGWNGKNRKKAVRKESKFNYLKNEICKCQMCGRPKHMQFKGDSLEVHHIDEIKDGGEDVRINIIILCTGCHKLTHWIRTYQFNHIAPMMDAYTNENMKEIN